MRTSPGSSSTSSTSTSSRPPRSAMSGGLLIFVRYRQGETERGSGAGRGFQPDPATVILNDLPAHSSSDTSAGIAGAVMQSLEDHEDPVGVLGLDSDPVVADREFPELILAADRHNYPRRLVAAELD